MKTIERAARLVVDFCAILSVLCVAGIMLISVLDVIMRGIFNSPIIGATEISQMLMVGAVLGAGGGILTDQNIQVDIVVNALPKKAQQILGVQNALDLIHVAFDHGKARVSSGDHFGKPHLAGLLDVDGFDLCPRHHQINRRELAHFERSLHHGQSLCIKKLLPIGAVQSLGEFFARDGLFDKHRAKAAQQAAFF